MTTMQRIKFEPPRNPAEYVGQPGSDLNGLLLSPAGYDAVAESKVTGAPVQILVIGEYRRSDGARWLDYGMNPAWITATSDFRIVDGTWLWRCPECELYSGKHTRTCPR